MQISQLEASSTMASNVEFMPWPPESYQPLLLELNPAAMSHGDNPQSLIYASGTVMLNDSHISGVMQIPNANPDKEWTKAFGLVDGRRTRNRTTQRNYRAYVGLSR